MENIQITMEEVLKKTQERLLQALSNEIILEVTVEKLKKEIIELLAKIDELQKQSDETQKSERTTEDIEFKEVEVQ